MYLLKNHQKKESLQWSFSFSMQTHPFPHFSPPETPDSFTGEASGVVYCGLSSGYEVGKTATDSGNFASLRSVSAGMTGGVCEKPE